MDHTSFFVFILGINILAYGMMYVDKQASIKKQSRIPEKYIILFAICTGSLGVYLGMKEPIRHKTSKPLFKIGVPFIIILQVFIFIKYYF